MTLSAVAADAAATLRGHGSGTHWFLATDSDADGLAAAAVMGTALRRLGHRVTIRASRDKRRDALVAVADTECDGVMFLDKGTAHSAALLARARDDHRTLAIIDHHAVPDNAPPPATDFVFVNPRAVGLDGGKDACSSTTAYAVAVALDERNADLAASALVGAIGDWQHVGGWQGWNADVVAAGNDQGSVVSRPGLRLAGGPLQRALTIGAAGRLLPDSSAIARLLAERGIAGIDTLDALDDEAHTHLASHLVLAAVARGNDVGVVPDDLVGDGMTHARLGVPLRQAFALADACGREGRTGLGIALLMGDTGALPDARACLAAYQGAIHTGLATLRDRVVTDGPLQWACIDDARYTGMVAGLGMEHALADNARPAIVAAPRDDELLQVSSRGTAALVAAGLDLATAVETAAAAAGGEGGGHPMAAGATIPTDGLPAFLAALAQALKQQPWVASLDADE